MRTTLSASRHFIRVLAPLAIATTCATVSNAGPAEVTAVAESATMEAWVEDPWDLGRLEADLGYLASPALGGRVPGSDGGAAARAFVARRWAALGLAPGGEEGYVQPFRDSRGDAAANVIGVLRGSDPDVATDVIVIGAHLDHLGDSEGAGLRLGANDNASGVTAVLAIADAMVHGPPPRRTVVFAIFDSEERGCEGSHRFLEHPVTAAPIGHVVYDVNFDMVGSYRQWGSKVVAHGSVVTTPAFAELLPLLRTSGLNVEIDAPGIEEDDSDYAPFCAAGIPFVGFFTHDPDCYHQSCDTVDRIDFDNLSRIVGLGAELTRALSDTPRDLAAFRARATSRELGCTGYPSP